MMVFNLTLGLSTPPVGACLFMSASIAGLPVMTVSKEVLKCIGAMLVVLFLITYFPQYTVMPLVNIGGQ